MTTRRKIALLFSVILIILSSILVYETKARSIFDIKNIFSKSENTQQKNSKNKEEVSIIAVGDIMLSRNVETKIRGYKDYNHPYLKTKDYLKTGDIVFGNLETTITPGRKINTNELTFRSDVENAKALKDNGFTILSLANNHTGNFGQKGFKDTIDNLTKEGIKIIGAGENKDKAKKPIIIEKNSLKFAFLAYAEGDLVPKSYEAGDKTYGIVLMDENNLNEDIRSAKLNANFVIVSMHAGVEYKNTANRYQTNFAHKAIDAGADLVIGHHPHVVQNIEKYKNKYILYSLGNFIFDQMWSQNTKEGVIAKITFNKTGVKNIEFKPIIIEDYSQPRFTEKNETEKILKKLKI